MDTEPAPQNPELNIPLTELEQTPSGATLYFAEYKKEYIPEEKLSVIEDHSVRAKEENTGKATQMHIPYEYAGFKGTQIIFDQKGDPSFLLFSKDIDEVVRIQELSEQATVDPLTQLDNRGGWYKAMERLSSDIYRQDAEGYISMIMIDLNNFDTINNTKGHAAGDRALVEVSKRLQSIFRPNDEIARWGGDEFAIFLQSDEDTSKKIKERLEAISDSTLRFSVGIYTIPTKGIYREAVANKLFGKTILESIQSELSMALDRADKLMYDAKHEAQQKSGGFAKPTVIHTLTRPISDYDFE